MLISLVGMNRLQQASSWPNRRRATDSNEDQPSTTITWASEPIERKRAWYTSGCRGAGRCHGSRWCWLEGAAAWRPAELDDEPGEWSRRSSGRGSARRRRSWSWCRCWPRTPRRGEPASRQGDGAGTLAARRSAGLSRPGGAAPAGHGGRRRGRGGGEGRGRGASMGLDRDAGVGLTSSIVRRQPPRNLGSAERARSVPTAGAARPRRSRQAQPGPPGQHDSSTPAAARRRRAGPSGSTQAGSRGASR